MSEPVSSSKPAANLQEEQKATLPSPKPVVIVAADILEEGELPQPDPEVQSEGLPEEEPIVEGGEEDKGAASEGEEGPHLGKKKKKKKSKAIKKLFMTFKGLVKKKAERGQTLHPIEKCFLEGNWIMTYKKDKNTLLIRLLQKHFKEKHNELYKSERDTADLPHDFSSTKGVPVKVSKINQKYYEKRYYLFSKFDEGIELDEESWYSVTPEEIAAYIAKKCKSKCVLDAFCGAGGNSIQSERVYANDIDGKKLEMAGNNAQIYKANDKITFINKDFLKLDRKADFVVPPEVVFVSPPWGGVAYSKEEIYNLGSIKPNFVEIVSKSLELAENLVLFLPRNIDLEQLSSVLLQYNQLYPQSNNGECIATMEALVYGGKNIKALLVCVGPMFQELFPRIKLMFNAPFEPYESIIVQNIMKALSFSTCYETAIETQKSEGTPKEYIGKLKERFTEEQWGIVKRLHKKNKQGKGLEILRKQREEGIVPQLAGKRPNPEPGKDEAEVKTEPMKVKIDEAK